MADNEINVKLTLEAEDKARAVLDAAKKHTQELIDKQKELQKLLDEDTKAQIAGDKAKMMSAKQYFDTTHQVQVALTQQINNSYRLQNVALAQLTTAHQNHAKAVVAANNQKTQSLHGVTGALQHYIKHFVTLAAAEETIRRSIDEYAKWERGMARIEIQTGSTTKGVLSLAHSIDVLARRTGISVADLQKNFMTFHAGIGDMNYDVVHMFEEIVNTAHTAGISVDVMARTAVAAIQTMNVPFGEVKDVLATVVKEIPASAMGAWDNAKDKILSVLRSIGSTGAASFGQAAQSFGVLSLALGNGQNAANALNRMLARATDQSTMFGKVMTQQMIANQGTAGESLKFYQNYHNELVRLGAIDPANPQRAMTMRQANNITEEEVHATQRFLETWQKIEETAARTGKPVDEVRASIMRLQRGPQAVLDDLKGSFGELFTALGKFLGTAIPDAITTTITALADNIERVNIALEKWREITGARDAKTHEETPDKGLLNFDWFDPGSWVWGAITGETVEQQREHARTAPPGTLSGGRRGFGLEDYFSRWFFGSRDPAIARQDRAITGDRFPQAPQLGGRRVPSTAPRPGYATGGEFRVGGQGGVDSQPVEFMATPGEHVAITSPLTESLQQQQDKADQAMREYLARFRPRSAARTPNNWWPSSTIREAGPGAGGAMPSMAGGGGGGGGADRTGTRTPQGTQPDVTNPPATPPYQLPPAMESPGGIPFIGPDGQPSTAPNAAPAASTTTGPSANDQRPRAGRRQTLADRNNNPGNIEWGPFARDNGATGPGQGGRFARFPDRETGFRAAEALLGGSRYRGLTLRQIGARWAERDPRWAQNVSRATGIGLDTVLSPEQRSQVARRGIPVAEGSAYGPAPPRQAGPAGPAVAPGWPQTSVPSVMPGGPPVATGGGGTTEQPGTGPIVGGRVGPVSRGSIRNLELDPRLREAVEYAAERANINVRITSGGQGAGRDPRMRDRPGGWTGSLRHNNGLATDVELYDPATNRVLELNDPRRLQFLEHTAAAGAGGTGTRYMRHSRTAIHVGLTGGRGVVGEGLGVYSRQSTAAEVAAVNRGLRNRLTPEQIAAERRRQNALRNPNAPPRVTDATPEQIYQGNPFGAGTTRPPPATVPPNWANPFSNGVGPTIPPATAPPVSNWVPPPVTPSDLYGTNPPSLPRGVRAVPRWSEDARTGAREQVGTRFVGGYWNARGQFIRQANRNWRTQISPEAREWARQQAPTVDAPSAETAEARAEGGTARAGGSYLVGEQGPELFKPNTPGNIYANGKGGVEGPGVKGGSGIDVSDALTEYRRLAEEFQRPIRPNIEFPRLGPIRHRMSRRIEQQRQIDVGQLTREAAHSDIGMQ